MSAFPNTGRSDTPKSTKTKVRFRPEPVGRNTRRRLDLVLRPLVMADSRTAGRDFAGLLNPFAGQHHPGRIQAALDRHSLLPCILKLDPESNNVVQMIEHLMRENQLSYAGGTNRY